MPMPKFNFIPESQLKPKGETCFHITITKNGNLYFPGELISTYDLQSAFLKIFVELENKLIGYSIIKSADHLEGMKDLRKLSINKRSHAGIIQVAKILQMMGFKNESTSRSNPYLFSSAPGKYPIKKYESTYLMGEVYYIDLKNKKDEKSN